MKSLRDLEKDLSLAVRLEGDSNDPVVCEVRLRRNALRKAIEILSLTHGAVSGIVSNT